ncbi:MAG: NADP-dependent phosphogluconate dehydrogenase [Bacteroidales bacterium]
MRFVTVLYHLSIKVMENRHSGLYQIGMIGLGVMGRNFVLNLADHGFRVAGYDNDPGKVRDLKAEYKGDEVAGFTSLADFIGSLQKPRMVMMLVPAGAPVDAVINELSGSLGKGDIIIDAGNSYFKDTDMRHLKLKAVGIHFLGTGVSGGEEGARHGPSIMPGGPEEAYRNVKPLFEAAAAKVGNEPCVTWLGPGSAGHFVKMVHNGIEYGIMQLIAETFDLMKRGLELNDNELHDIYSEWNQGDLSSYLLEITSVIFNTVDASTGKRLINEILDVARQKGTGMWTSQSAMELQVPVPTIDIAVAMRDLSVFEDERRSADNILHRTVKHIEIEKDTFVAQLRNAYHAAMIITYAQGMAILSKASEKYSYNLDLEAVARIWRGGCIIRAALLEKISNAFHKGSGIPNLLLYPEISHLLLEKQEDLRHIVNIAVSSGLPVPAMMASLGYFDAYRSPWLPANLVQAQRDFFGAHTYERIDEKGTFHTEWLKR